MELIAVYCKTLSVLTSVVQRSKREIDANSLWIIEGVHISGVDCQRSQQVRIKHMMSNRYLTFNSDGHLCAILPYANNTAGELPAGEARSPKAQSAGSKVSANRLCVFTTCWIAEVIQGSAVVTDDSMQVGNQILLQNQLAEPADKCCCLSVEREYGRYLCIARGKQIKQSALEIGSIQKSFVDTLWGLAKLVQQLEQATDLILSITSLDSVLNPSLFSSRLSVAKSISQIQREPRDKRDSPKHSNALFKGKSNGNPAISVEPEAECTEFTLTPETMHTTTFFVILEELSPRLEDVLEQMCKQCTVSDELDVLLREGEPDELFQQFMRQMRVGDKIVQLFLHISNHLQVPSQWFQNGCLSQFHRMVRLGYRVIKQMVKQNVPNSHDMARYSPYMATQVLPACAYCLTNLVLSDSHAAVCLSWDTASAWLTPIVNSSVTTWSCFAQ